MGGSAAKNAKLIIHEPFISLFWALFSAIGEREAMICLELQGRIQNEGKEGAEDAARKARGEKFC